MACTIDYMQATSSFLPFSLVLPYPPDHCRTCPEWQGQDGVSCETLKTFFGCSCDGCDCAKVRAHPLLWMFFSLSRNPQHIRDRRIAFRLYTNAEAPSSRVINTAVCDLSMHIPGHFLVAYMNMMSYLTTAQHRRRQQHQIMQLGWW